MGILYGANYALRFEHTANNEDDAMKVKGDLEAAVKAVPSFQIEADN